MVAEPFGADHLVTVHSGIVHMAIHTYGVTGHIGRLEGTVNAVHTMTAIIDALRSVEFRHTPRPDLPAFPRLNVGSIIGGRGQDYVLVEPPYVPDLCTIMVDVHFVPGQTVDGHRRRHPSGARPAWPRAIRALRYEIEIPPPAPVQGAAAAGDGPARRAASTRRSCRRSPGATARSPGGSRRPSARCCRTRTAPTTRAISGRPASRACSTAPATIRGNADEDDACVLVSEMETVTRVLAVTALDVCRRAPAELALATRRA